MQKDWIHTLGVLIMAFLVVIQVGITEANVENLRNITPDKPFVFVQLTGASSIVKTDSNFWKQVAEAPFWELVYANIESSSKVKDMHLAIEPGVSLLSYIFGEDVVFVFPQFQQFPEISPLLMLKLKGEDDSLKSIIVNGIKISMANSAKSTSEYGGYTISLIPLKEGAPFALSCALMDDVFAIGLGDLTLKKVIDLMNDLEDAKAVTKDMDFSSIMQRLSLPDDSKMDEHLSMFYLDVSNLSAFGKSFYSTAQGNIPQQARPLVAKLMELIDLVSSVSSTMSLTDEGLISQGYVALNPDATLQNVMDMLQAKPEKLNSIEFAPKDVMGYNGGNLMDLKVIWEVVLETLKGLPQFGDQAFNQLEKMQRELGLSIEEDLISWMGNETAFIYNESPNFSKEHIPQEICWIFKAADAEKALKGLKNITDAITKISEGKIIIQEHGYSDQTIYQLSGLPVPITTSYYVGPGYAIVDDYVLISISTDYIQKLIDCKAGRIDNLDKNELFQSVADRLPEEVNSIQFMNTRHYIESVIISASGNQIPSWEDEKLDLPKTVMIQISELASLLSQAFGASIGYTVKEGSGLKTVSFIQIKDLESVKPISDPKVAKVIRGLAIADTYRKANMHERALSHYMEALELDPENWQANMGVADVLSKQDKKQEASQYIVKTGFAPEDTWYIIGPFDNPSGEGVDMEFPPEDSIQLDGEYEGKSGIVKWEKQIDDSFDGFVDLKKMLDPDQWTVAYAWAKVMSGADQEVQLRVGSDDQIVVWLNGQEVLRHEAPRAAQVDQDIIPVTLKEGENQLLLKVVNEQVDWGFYLRFTDTSGNPLRDLEYGE